MLARRALTCLWHAEDPSPNLATAQNEPPYFLTDTISARLRVSACLSDPGRRGSAG